jgi:GTP cyclohydrolase I
LILEDVQSQADGRGIALDQVGVSGIRYPLVVLDREHAKQETVGEFSLCIQLPASEKGAHMSRFIEVLTDHTGEVTMHTLPTMLDDLRSRLGSDRAAIRVRFPYFVEREAPVSGARALMDYDCEFAAEGSGDCVAFSLTVRVPVTSVCPCSKAISDYGAHNQRGYITISIHSSGQDIATHELVWIEELIELAEQSASAPVLPLVKRPDERHLTMLAYDNPVFVEDMVRNVVERLAADQRVKEYSVEAVNDESIHNHAAFARTSSSSIFSGSSTEMKDA